MNNSKIYNAIKIVSNGFDGKSNEEILKLKKCCEAIDELTAYSDDINVKVLVDIDEIKINVECFSIEDLGNSELFYYLCQNVKKIIFESSEKSTYVRACFII